MKKALPIIVLAAAALIFIVICKLVSSYGLVLGIVRKESGNKQRQIAVIPKATTHIFWESVRRGAEYAGAEAGVKIYWNGPDRESDRDKQIQIINDFIVQKVSGIVLAPNDSKALVPAVEKIYAKNIPCAIIDSGIETDKYVSFVATDNYKGGVIAARRMGAILNNKGKIIVVKYMPGSASTTNRENGFIDTIRKEFPEIEIVDMQYGKDTVETALQTTEDLLTKNTELDGLYACNASTAVGAMRALKTQGRAETVKMVGFDTERALIDGLKEGVIDSLVAQNPFRMGYEGVKAVLAAMDGKKVEKRIDTGVELITKENLETPEIQALLK